MQREGGRGGKDSACGVGILEMPTGREVTNAYTHHREENIKKERKELGRWLSGYEHLLHTHGDLNLAPTPHPM